MEERLSNEEIKRLARAIVDEMDSDRSAELAPKWEGASIFFIPKDSSAKDKELPIDALLHKIVLIRDNLRILEAKINANDALSEGEKVKLQSYITRCYGSLTSFNFLFYDEDDKFKSK